MFLLLAAHARHTLAQHGPVSLSSKHGTCTCWRKVTNTLSNRQTQEALKSRNAFLPSFKCKIKLLYRTLFLTCKFKPNSELKKKKKCFKCSTERVKKRLIIKLSCNRTNFPLKNWPKIKYEAFDQNYVKAKSVWMEHGKDFKNARIRL